MLFFLWYRAVDRQIHRDRATVTTENWRGKWFNMVVQVQEDRRPKLLETAAVGGVRAKERKNIHFTVNTVLLLLLQVRPFSINDVLAPLTAPANQR